MGRCVRGFRGLGIAIAVLGGVLFCVLAAALGTAGPARAQSASQIVVEGNKRVEADTIRSYFRGGAEGERLDAARIDAGLKALYATGLFQDVQIHNAGGRVVVTVIENPVINRVAFEGNKKAKDEQLQAEIQSKARGTFSRATVQSDVSRIIDVYHHTGRYDVTVDPKIIELPSNRVDLVFEINEGQKTGVADIIFVGNKHYSDYRLRDVIKTGITRWWSFLKSNDIYDADRVEVDRDLLRRFYLRNGFADVRIVSAAAEYDPTKKGFVITFTIEEGDQYKFGSVDIQSTVNAVRPETLREALKMSSGQVYNADLVEKTVEDLTIDVAKRGYPFASVKPRGDRDFEHKLVNVVFTLEEGPHSYIERINIRGNTKTRDYVIRREFDIVEGDAYNHALIDRAERRLKNLGYFKTVKITSEPGSAPDRVIVNVDVEEQSTGEFSFSGGYSTADGVIGEVSVGERNLLGTGDIARASIQYGSRSRGFNLSYVEPYLFGERLALGLDVFAKQTTTATYVSYTSSTIGGDVKLGIPITDNLSTQVHYTAYSQEIQLPTQFNNCNNINPDFVNTFPTPAAIASGQFNGNTAFNNAVAAGTQQNCYQDGEASLAVRKELAAGPVFVSLVGYGFTYNTLDNNHNPTSGIIASISQDLAGVGGDVNFIKTTGDFKLYDEVLPDIVGLLRFQGGYATGWGGQGLRMLDHFQAGPNMVRGFAPAGFGPRDLTPGTNLDALGGSLYWAATVEFQTPLWFAPKDFGMRFATFADAGQLLNYVGPTSWAQTGETLTTCENGAIGQLCDDTKVRSSVGVGLIWDSPFGPLRFDLAYPLTKMDYDHTQIFRFGGGTKF
ncbi:MAG TPA: outer membrane protein assembly factor BamA [Xanthobacteraceae bacterium]|nr:outer membrane protein assembly factor BamA [Xanthobacteraceae bacterium]